MMISSLQELKVTSQIPKRKLPSDRKFMTPESKGYEVALAKQWLAKFLARPEVTSEQQSTEEDHEEIYSGDDIPM